MSHRNKIIAFVMQYVHLFLLGVASIISLGALVCLSKFDVSRLNSFGPAAQLYFIGIKNGITASTIILLSSFVIGILFRKHFELIRLGMESFFLSLSDTKKNLLVLVVCFIFAFTSHAGNIINGYFNMDDFEAIAHNQTLSFTQAIFTLHGNDHSLPLFNAEMKAFEIVFGQNPVPYNLFVFILFALIPFFTYLSFKKLKIGMGGFFVFLILFSGATGWDDMLTGFYIMSIYLQIVFFFSVALWSYLAWTEDKRKKYMFFFALSLIGALGADISGMWTLPAMALVMMYHSYAKTDTFFINKKSLADFFSDNKIALIVFLGVIIGFASFFIFTFVVQHPNTFLSAINESGTAIAGDKEKYWKIIPLSKNFVSFFTSGISLSLFAPKVAQFASHPAIKATAEKFYPIVEMIVLFMNIILFWLAAKYAKAKEKKLMLLLAGIMFITIMMVIIARPNHSAIPDFDYRYAGPAFYIYCIFLALGSSLLSRAKKEYSLKIIVPAVIIIFSAQQAFSFQSFRTMEESKMRKEAITRLDKTLLSELEKLSAEKKDGVLVVPNLSGGNIYHQTLGGFTLSYYVLFFNKHMPLQLIQSPEILQDNKTQIVISVSSLRASTSPEFIEALKKSEIIRSYYLSPKPQTNAPTNHLKEILIEKNEIDPEKIHTVNFTLSTDNTEGNLSLYFSFKNDFNADWPVSRIKVDEFTPYEIQNDKRVYRMETNLLGSYEYALSKTISHISLLVPDTKNASVSNLILK